MNAPGPWEAHFYTGTSGARFWTLRRTNPKWFGGYEIKNTAQWKPIRFKTEVAAVRAAAAQAPHPSKSKGETE